MSCPLHAVVSKLRSGHVLPPVYIVIHIAMIRHYLSVMEHLKHRLQSAGLYGKGITLLFGSCGPETGRIGIHRLFQDHPDWHWIAHDENVHCYERVTLHAMREYALRHAPDNALFLYLHSKGVSRNWNAADPTRGSLGWTYFMTNFVCMYAPLAWQVLCTNPAAFAVGVQTMPFGDQMHFSGNFWWTTPRHLRQLQVPIGGNYLDPEMWIGARGGLVSLYQLPQWKCLHTSFCPSRFVNQPMAGTMNSPIVLGRWPDESWFGFGQHMVSVPLPGKRGVEFTVSVPALLGESAPDPAFGFLKMWILSYTDRFMVIMENQQVYVR